MSEKDYSVHKNARIKMSRCVQERVATTGSKLIICKRAREIGRSCIIVYRHSKHSERRSISKIFRLTCGYSLLSSLEDSLLRFNFFPRSCATTNCSD